MSGRALRQAVREAIKTRLSLSSKECGVEPGPKPPPSAGPIYVAVHPGPWKELSLYEGNYSDHQHGVRVTTSVRAGHIPQDKIGNEVINTVEDGLEKWAEEIIAAVHDIWDTVNNANTILQSITDEFGEPLRFQFANEPDERDGKWWTAGMEHQHSKTQNPHNSVALGYSQTLLFDGARRTRFTTEQGWP